MGEGLKAAVRANFTARRALGLGLDVLRRRPGGFLRLSLVQTLAFALPSLGLIYVMALFGAQLSDPGADPADLLRAQGLMTLSLIPLYAVIIVVAIWVEAYWLELFLNDRVTLAPPVGRALWLLLSFVVCYGAFLALYLVGFLVTAVAAVFALTVGGEAAGVLTAAVCLLVFLVALALLMARFTALPALSYMKGDLALAHAWTAAGAKQGGVILAWLGSALIYLAVMTPFSLLLVFGPGPYGEAMRHQFENPDNPFAAYEIYGQLADDPAQLGMLAVTMVLGGLIYALLAAISRGVGVVLARAATEAP